MTANDMMTPRALLEKSSDADLLHEMIGFTAERLTALEVDIGRRCIFVPDLLCQRKVRGEGWFPNG